MRKNRVIFIIHWWFQLAMVSNKLPYFHFQLQCTMPLNASNKGGGRRSSSIFSWIMEYRVQFVFGRLREILLLDWDIGLLQYLPAVFGTLLARNYFGLHSGLLGFADCGLHTHDLSTKEHFCIKRFITRNFD
jgi:hypothetical protein